MRASTVHVAVSLSHKPKKAHRKLHRSQKVKKMQRALLFYTYFEVKFIMLEPSERIFRAQLPTCDGFELGCVGLVTPASLITDGFQPQ